jgi:hypothetical protein
MRAEGRHRSFALEGYEWQIAELRAMFLESRHGKVPHAQPASFHKSETQRSYDSFTRLKAAVCRVSGERQDDNLGSRLFMDLV